MHVCLLCDLVRSLSTWRLLKRSEVLHWYFCLSSYSEALSELSFKLSFSYCQAWNHFSFLIWLIFLVFDHKSTSLLQIFIKAAFGSCSALCYICTHKHIHTHFLSQCVHFVNTSESGNCPVSLWQSWAQTQFSFKGIIHLHIERATDIALACPCLLCPVHCCQPLKW